MLARVMTGIPWRGLTEDLPATQAREGRPAGNRPEFPDSTISPGLRRRPHAAQGAGAVWAASPEGSGDGVSRIRVDSPGVAEFRDGVSEFGSRSVRETRRFSTGMSTEHQRPNATRLAALFMLDDATADLAGGQPQPRVDRARGGVELGETGAGVGCRRR